MTVIVPALEEIEDILKGSISRPTKRDKQVAIGPSGVGGCMFCLGYEMARKFFGLPQRGDSFGYASWLGTMCHEWLQNHLELPVDTLREHKVHVFDIEGYGPLKGSTDLIVPAWRRTFDWKFPGKSSYDKVRLALATGGRPSAQYRAQQQCYAHGANLAGIPVEWCVLAFFPRHTNSLDDLLLYEEPYSPEYVEIVKARAEAVFEDVMDGNLDHLPSDPDCFECSEFLGTGRPSTHGYLTRPIAQFEQKGASE